MVTDIRKRVILFQCPVETLSLVLQAVESPGERLEVARKLRVSSVVVDVLLAQKDRAALLRKLNQLNSYLGFFLN